MKSRNLILWILFAVIVLEVLFNSLDHTTVPEFIFKPLIMVWIASYFIVNLTDKNHPVVVPTLIAFFFSWVGDLLLLFSGTLYFLSGLGAFLIAHLFYIFAFLGVEDRKRTPFLKKYVWMILPFIAYSGSMFWILFPGMSPYMRMITIIYTVTIMSMAGSALNRKARVPENSFLLVMMGAIFFVCSDSLIAVNKFASKIPHSGFWVMSSYILAQLMIMIGLLSQFKKENVQHEGYHAS